MTLTDFHSAFFAHELTKRCPSDSIEKFAGALVDAQVKLHPHQVEAALFAFRSPLSRGAMLADEVGLGKTIEAGLVISQKWAERKRKLLVITPSNLRKQWHQEMQEKFSLPCRILEARSYKAAVRSGTPSPFEPADAVVICSYQFAKTKAADLTAVLWDLVVIDEAHRLRNVYKPSNVIANVLKNALAAAPKLLLTATPLQNSLLELFGLVSFIDEHAFGDLKSFREQFANLSEEEVFEALKARLRPICHRSLRRQVVEYVPFTKRHAMVEEFTPADSEDLLYNEVSAYLRRDNLQALPTSQRSLMTMVLRKLLASSTFAIAGALETLIARLKGKLVTKAPVTSLEEEFEEEYEGLDETAEEWGEEEDDEPPLSDSDQAAIDQEVRDLEGFRDLAMNITQNAKGFALLTALGKAFEEADRLGAARKAIIFTESRKTQDYILRLLGNSPYRDGIVLFNGSNTDIGSKAIYAEWVKKHANTEKVSGSRTADMRSALVDYFRDTGSIMIATEAGAEGINLQFCSLVVNYDLPWNPQRIEQRIGRCHRYGQKFDVVVVNFINLKNDADRRVFELLDEKFKLFEGVFGASDEVLGAIESGVDFEKRIAEIYQGCRTAQEISESFVHLQRELTLQINEAMTKTRRQLLENFDDEVHEKLRISKSESDGYQSGYERMLMRMTRHELNGHAQFNTDDTAFELRANPFPDLHMPMGRYELPRRSGESHLYRIGHTLAQRLLHQAREKVLPPAEIVFDYAGVFPRVAAFQAYRNLSGELLVQRLSIESMDQGEDHMMVAAITDNGKILPSDFACKFFLMAASAVNDLSAFPPDERLVAEIERQQAAIRRTISERNGKLFEEEASKLDGWADDLKVGLEREIRDLDRQLKEAKRAASAALTLEEKLAGQR
ncbi:DEAD/DEAH box helicase family protein [Gemmata sp. G18]|uniref:DEAD/DEAH box helicase family protein n=1 Tax=Gemmata palustris TaxID=2822762 RepID=A0ABS5BL08_9BACT|nr:SNF2-related protein [Gemmata palustris]MBP3954392.1 DEAD/DEAH box helicase family protein [Gemmata palustris]